MAATPSDKSNPLSPVGGESLRPEQSSAAAAPLNTRKEYRKPELKRLGLLRSVTGSESFGGSW